MTKHYLIFVHGMGDLHPNQDPFESYNQLWRLLVKESPMDEQEFESKFDRIRTNWHINQLQQAAITIQDAAFPELRKQKLNPMRGLRGFMTNFLGDVIAYVSEDVNLIRRTVWEQIWQKLKQPLNEGATYSIIAHSLGSAIMFDYLYYLFKPESLQNPDKEALFVPEPKPDITSDDIRLLQKQFRHFFTFGSPIGLFMLRKDSLFVDQEPFTTLYNPVRGDNRAWYNFWDGQDMIAYPLANLFDINPDNRECKLVDEAVETGFLIIDSHTQYWGNKDLAERIVKVLNN